MEGILIFFILFVFVVGVLLLGYFDYKRMKKESDARTEMYNTLSIGITSVVCQLRNIRYCLEIFNVNMFADAESEDSEC